MSGPAEQPDPTLLEKVEAALKKMSTDTSIKRTKLKFAELVGVVPGTLYNHVWPITRFEKFRLDERQRKTEAPRPSDTTHHFEPARSDAEILGWKRKCDELKSENANLKIRIEDLRRELRKRDNPTGEANVISFPGAAR